MLLENKEKGAQSRCRNCQKDEFHFCAWACSWMKVYMYQQTCGGQSQLDIFFKCYLLYFLRQSLSLWPEAYWWGSKQVPRICPCLPRAERYVIPWLALYVAAGIKLLNLMQAWQIPHYQASCLPSTSDKKYIHSRFIYLLRAWMFCLHKCICTTCMLSIHRCQKRGLDTLELEL